MLDNAGEMKEDVNMPTEEHLSDVAKRIREIFDEGKKECLVTVLSTMNKELVIEVREGND